MGKDISFPIWFFASARVKLNFSLTSVNSVWGGTRRSRFSLFAVTWKSMAEKEDTETSSLSEPYFSILNGIPV